MDSANEVLIENGVSLAFHVGGMDTAGHSALIRQLYNIGMDGIVYYPVGNSLPLDALGLFTNASKPVIILDKAVDHPIFTNICCDNFNGGHMLTQHLVDYGHEKIAYISRFEWGDVPSIRDRYNGYLSCLAERGLQTNARFVKVEYFTEQTGYPLLKHTMNALYREGFTAAECENDEVAFNVYMCCRSLDIQIPQKFCITGFDNIHWATTGSAQITTVDQNFEMMGRALADCILDPGGGPRKIVAPVKLTPRTSTAMLSRI